MDQKVLTLLPERIFLSNRRWIAGKGLRIVNGKIHSVCDPARLGRKEPVLELPGIALVPGLVNVHAHLEYTDSGFPRLKRPGFTKWLDAMVAWKRRRQPHASEESLRRGVRECLRQGVVAVGDHCNAEIPLPLIRSPLRGVVFHEVISLNPARVRTVLQHLKEAADDFPRGRMRFGVALHAPYTLSDGLIRDAVHWARRRRIPLSMHVAESKEEAELFLRGEGPLLEWLRGKTGLHIQSPRVDPVAFLHRCGFWDGPVQAVHMNGIRRAQTKHLSPARVSIAYCPKSHEYFGHPRFTLEMFLARGHCVALGTDSLASNDALNMWEELRMAARLHPKIPREILWDMATVQGAKSLGLPACGKIQPGYWADLIGIPATRTRHPLAQTLRHQGPVAFSMIQGKLAWGAING